MRFSCVSTLLALAASVSAGVLRNVSSLKQLGSRDISPVHQLAARDTVVVTEDEVIQYAQTVTQYFTDCHGRLQAVAKIKEIITVLTKTVTTITDGVVDVDACGCQKIDHVAYTTHVKAVFAQVQVVIDYVSQKYPNHDFKEYWTKFGDCTKGFVILSKRLQIDLGIQLDILRILGIDIGDDSSDHGAQDGHITFDTSILYSDHPVAGS